MKTPLLFTGLLKVYFYKQRISTTRPTYSNELNLIFTFRSWWVTLARAVRVMRLHYLNRNETFYVISLCKFPLTIQHFPFLWLRILPVFNKSLSLTLTYQRHHNKR